MMLLFIWLNVLIAGAHSLAQGNGMVNLSIISDESRLVNDLLNKYDSKIRPINSSKHINVVALGLSMTDIFELHEQSQVFEAGAFLQHLWEDIRLKWDPSKYGGLTTIHLAAKYVWKPDIVLINNADVLVEKEEPLVIIFHIGTVFYSPKHRLRVPCILDLSRFPFDEQSCTLKFGSWTYDNSNINLTNLLSGDKGLDMNELRSNSEWTILSATAIRMEKQYEFGHNKFIVMEYSFKLRRNPVFYTHVFILPAVLLAIVVPFQFLLPPESKERITLGTILMLGIILLLVMLQDFLPEAHPTIPTIASYYTITLIWITLSLLASIWVVNVQSRGPRKKKVPSFMRHFFLRGMKRLVCLGNDTYYPLDESETISMRGLDRQCDGITRPEVATSQNKLERDVEEILRHVHTLTLRSTVIEARQEIQNEWHQVALVIDRILCFLFIMTFLLYTFVLLA